MRSDNLRRRKYWIRFIDLYEWAYKKEYDATFDACFTDIIKFFDGSYDNPYDKSDTPAKLPTIFYTDEQFIECMLDMFEMRRLAWPQRIGYWSWRNHELIDSENKANIDIMMRMSYRITEICRLNKDKWTKLIGSTMFDYNPIENYNMSESGTDNRTLGNTTTLEKDGDIKTTPTGSESNSREIDTHNVSHFKVDAPVSSLSGGFDSEGEYHIDSLTLQHTKEVDTEVNTGIAHGSKAGGALGDLTGQTADIGTTGGTEVQNKNYTTTYDDAAEGRLHDYTTTTGTTADATNSSQLTKTDLSATATVEYGNPSAFGFTDTTSFTNREDKTTFDTTDTTRSSGTDNLSHSLTRTGNIGVTTSQQMIQSERELLISAGRQILEEIANEIFLNVWD